MEVYKPWKSQFWCKPLVFLVLKKALKLLPVMFWVIVFLFLYLVSLLESAVTSIFKQSSESEHKVWLLPLKNSSCYQQSHRPTPVIQQSLIRPLFLPLCLLFSFSFQPNECLLHFIWCLFTPHIDRHREKLTNSHSNLDLFFHNLS